MVKNVIESLYVGRCSITEFRAVKDEKTKIAKNQEIVVVKDVPCRVSFKNSSTLNQSDMGATATQKIKLFISPTMRIKPGSKITVVQNGATGVYQFSAEPAIYSSHQEILLDLFKGWS